MRAALTQRLSPNCARASKRSSARCPASSSPGARRARRHHCPACRWSRAPGRPARPGQNPPRQNHRPRPAAPVQPRAVHPDLMPADILGTNVLLEAAHGGRAFQFQPGPIFANLVLADEINRATPKTQSALLEAMQEQAVTVGTVGHPLPRPFFVLATQNPIEMEGTYPLPEAELDRFSSNSRSASLRGPSCRQLSTAPPARVLSHPARSPMAHASSSSRSLRERSPWRRTSPTTPSDWSWPAIPSLSKPLRPPNATCASAPAARRASDDHGQQDPRGARRTRQRCL